MPTLTLARAGNPLASASRQLEILSAPGHKPFEASLADSGHGPLHAAGIRTLQVNVGKMCNQTCRHCHVDAGPDRREIATQEMLQACLDAMRAADIPTIDVTGGAPEMNPHFRWLVGEAHAMGRHVIDRCNLTILLAPHYEDMPEFLAEHDVEIVASLPCYSAENTDKQRGDGVFDKSITALKRLNSVGYGMPDTGRTLTLVYNPGGPSLPPPQASLEAAYKERLREDHGVEFNRLFTITNMPISRFLDDLIQQGRFDEYMEKLIGAYNPDAVDGVMCRTTLSVGWDGQLYDCDFNQMLELGTAPGQPATIFDFDAGKLAARQIVTARHCYGCTAGSGSGCTGAIV